MLRAVIIITIALAGVAAAEPPLRVIVHAENPAGRLDKHFIADVFLKKRTHWDDDTGILPVDLGQKSSVRERFSHDILGRDVSSVRRYWAQLVFSGRGVPPPELATESDVIKYVASHRGAIGYVSGAVALAGVKVIEVE